MRLNDNERPAPGDPLDDRMLPVVEVNRDGVVGVAWYDRRRDDTRRCWELFFTSSSDGGETFAANVPVASAPSCPPPAHAPVARVHNVAADPDVKDLTEEEIAQMDLVQRMTIQMAEQSRNARAEYFGDLGHARLEVSFDNARGNQPGHYLGLAGRRERRLSSPVDQPPERDRRTVHDHGGSDGGRHAGPCRPCGRGDGCHGRAARGDGARRLRRGEWHGDGRGAATGTCRTRWCTDPCGCARRAAAARAASGRSRAGWARTTGSRRGA